MKLPHVYTSKVRLGGEISMRAIHLVHCSVQILSSPQSFK